MEGKKIHVSRNNGGVKFWVKSSTCDELWEGILSLNNESFWIHTEACLCGGCFSSYLHLPYLTDISYFRLLFWSPIVFHIVLLTNWHSSNKSKISRGIHLWEDHMILWTIHFSFASLETNVSLCLSHRHLSLKHYC